MEMAFSRWDDIGTVPEGTVRDKREVMQSVTLQLSQKCAECGLPPYSSNDAIGSTDSIGSEKGEKCSRLWDH
jgi:hypothetical protein